MKILSPIILAALVSISSLAHSAEYNEAEGIISNAHFEVRLGDLGFLNNRKVELVDGVEYAIDYWSGLFGNNHLGNGKVTIDLGSRDSGLANCESNQIIVAENATVSAELAGKDLTLNGKEIGTYSSAELLLQFGVDVGDAADMTITLNQNNWFYYSTNVMSNNLLDLPSILIHEMAHGLGVNKGAIITSPSLAYPIIQLDKLTTWEAMFNVNSYDDIEYGLGITMGDPSLGLNVYNPDPYNSGSNLIHIDKDSDPNAVMQYLIKQGDVRREFTAKELALFQAMGWNFVPEPSSTFLVLLSLPVLLGRRRRARRARRA